MIKKLRTYLLESFKNKKINVFFLFLISAFGILILTKLSKQYTNTIVFDIEKINVPQENVVLNDTNAVLRLTLKTHGFKWLNYYVTKPKIVIDFSNDVYKDDSVFLWHKSRIFLNNTQFDKQVELLHMSPDTLVFPYGVNFMKKVPVKLKSHINFASGYDVSEAYTLEPDSVEIIGPDLLVKGIRFIETDSVELTNIRENILEKLQLNLPEHNGDLKFSNTNVYLKAKVEKFTEGTIVIPVNIINLPKGTNLKYFPKEVNVSYYVSLSDFNSIKNNDFRVVCDYKKTNASQTILIPELVKIPKSVKNTKISQQRIEFIIRE